MPICQIILTLALVSVDCPQPRPSAADAARILEVAPGLSNRTHVYSLSVEEQRRPRVVFVSTPAAPPQPKVQRESEQARANRLGVPGGYSVLEWSILNSGGGAK